MLGPTRPPAQERLGPGDKLPASARPVLERNPTRPAPKAPGQLTRRSRLNVRFRPITDIWQLTAAQIRKLWIAIWKVSHE